MQDYNPFDYEGGVAQDGSGEEISPATGHYGVLFCEVACQTTLTETGALNDSMKEIRFLRKKLDELTRDMVSSNVALQVENEQHVLNSTMALESSFREKLASRKREEEGNLGRVRKSMSTTLLDHSAELKGRYKKEVNEALMAQKAESEKIIKGLKEKVSLYEREAMYRHAELKPMQGTIDRLKMLLTKNGIKFSIGNTPAATPSLINPEQMESDLKEARSEIELLNTKVEMLERNKRSLLSQLDQQRAIARNSEASAEDRNRELRSEIRRLNHKVIETEERMFQRSGEQEKTLRDQIYREVQSKLKDEYLAEQQRSMNRQKQASIRQAEEAKERLEEEREKADRAKVSLSMRHSRLMSEREAAHQEEIRRLKQIYEQKQHLTAAALKSLGSQEGLSIVSRRQKEVMNYASVLFKGKTTESGRSTPVKLPSVS